MRAVNRVGNAPLESGGVDDERQEHADDCDTAVLAVLSGLAISAQDKYTLQVPNGLPFSDCRGYEDWQLVSVAQTDERLKVILANAMRPPR
jgi:hypothetical protein